jgi:glycosyltransferase involved in cell wall biosynthesis
VPTIKVLQVITRMVKGGAQENTLATVAGIHGRGWESALVTGPALGPEGTLEPECLAAGVRILRVPDLVREISPRSDLRALANLKQVIRAERPQIVHTHTSKAGILGRLAAQACSVPVVVHTPHGHVFHSYESGLKSKLFAVAERWCAPKADSLIALTETERDEHLALGIGRPEQWSIVHSGVDFAPFEAARGSRAAARTELGIPQGAPVIGTVGRLVPIKGQQYLIEAFAGIAREFPTAHLVLAGDGELRQELVELARSHGLTPAPNARIPPLDAPRIHFLGLRRDVPLLMSAMDVFALPSLNEGMGRVLVEAMSMELPCVGSRVSGIPDVIEEGVTGLLVPSRDAQALEGALRQLLSQPKLARRMGEAGRSRAVPGFSVEGMVAKIEQIYRDLLQRQGIEAPTERIGDEASARPLVRAPESL